MQKLYDVPPKAETAVRLLEAQCREADGPGAPLFLDPSMNCSRSFPCLYLLYEGDTLVSALFVFAPSAREAELSGLTHPAQRRKGHFKQLWQAAQSDLAAYGIRTLLWAANGRFPHHAAVAGRLRAVHDFTEYWMVWEKTNRPDAAFHTMLDASPAAKDMLAMMRETFGDETEAELAARLQRNEGAANRSLFGCRLRGALIGCGGISLEGGQAMIFGLGIVPRLRGRGYGRELLMQLVREAERHAPAQVTLEVNAANDTALRLYRQCGFHVSASIAYFRHTP